MSGRKLGQGDIQRLYDEHGPALLAYARSIVRDRFTAEDLLHQVFLRLLQNGATVPTSPKACLAKAVRNAALNRRRNQRREVVLGNMEPWFESPAALRDASLALESALQRLPGNQREAVALHVWGEMTFAEMATVLSIPLNTAASRYRYGLAKLREQLGPER